MSTKAARWLFFCNDLNIVFWVLVIEHPMQWPWRLNLQTSMQGLGVFGMWAPIDKAAPGKGGCLWFFRKVSGVLEGRTWSSGVAFHLVKINLPARVMRKT